MSRAIGYTPSEPPNTRRVRVICGRLPTSKSSDQILGGRGRSLSDLAITRNRRNRRGASLPAPAANANLQRCIRPRPSINRAIDLTVASSCEGLQKGRITDQPNLNLLDHINEQAV